jgi:hypothetical protein
MTREIYECVSCKTRFENPVYRTWDDNKEYGKCPFCNTYISVYPPTTKKQIWIPNNKIANGEGKRWWWPYKPKRLGYWVDVNHPAAIVIEKVLEAFILSGEVTVEDLEHVDWNQIMPILKQHAIASYLAS